MVLKIESKFEEIFEQNMIQTANVVDKGTANILHMPGRCVSLEDLPLVLRVEDLMDVLSIGRNTAYELIRSRKIRSIRIGKSYRIPKEALVEFLNDVNM